MADLPKPRVGYANINPLFQSADRTRGMVGALARRHAGSQAQCVARIDRAGARRWCAP